MNTSHLAHFILFLGPLLVVPLGLRLLKQAQRFPFPTDYRSPSGIGWLIAVSMLAASLILPAGPLAAGLATPWLIVTLLLALFGTRWILKDIRDLNADFSMAAALVLVAVGGGWTLASRAGLRPAGFSDQIVMLTGVHFHYAGFALPLLTGWTVRQLELSSEPPGLQKTNTSRGWRRLLVASIVCGVPLVGLGITFSPLLEVVASGLLTLAACSLAVIQSLVAQHPAHAERRGLLWVSSISLFCGMTLAITYAAGEYLKAPLLTIPTMIPLHGIANAIGFSLCGLLAWNLPETDLTMSGGSADDDT
jgi:hypothetical protein